MTPRTRLTLLATLLSILIITLTPVGPSVHAWLVEGLGDRIGPQRLAVVLNVLLFVPLGAVIRYWGRSWVLVAAPALSVGIELTQLIIEGRNADPVDVIANTLGAVIGYAVGHVVLARRRRQHTENPPVPSFWPSPTAGTEPPPRADHHATRTRD